MDLQDKARWADACRTAGVEPNSAIARRLGVRQQLVAVEGVEVGAENETARAFDNERDFDRLPLGFLNPVWREIEAKSSLSEIDAGN